MDAATDWAEVTYAVFEAQGYRIVVGKVAPGEFCYLAFAPPLPDVQYTRKLKTHYALGEHVPQRREPLGAFASSAAARAACVTHLRARAA